MRERIERASMDYKGAARGDIMSDRFGNRKFREFDERGYPKFNEEPDSRL